MQDTKTNRKLKELFEVIDNNIGYIEENMKKKGDRQRAYNCRRGVSFC